MKKIILFILVGFFLFVTIAPTKIFAQTCECHNVSHYGVGDLSCEVNSTMNKCLSSTTAHCIGTINTCASAGCSCISNTAPTPTPIKNCYDDVGIINFKKTCELAGYTVNCPGYNNPKKCCAPGKCPAPIPTLPYKCVNGDPLHFSGCPPFIAGNTGPNAIDYSSYTYECKGGSTPRCCTTSAGCSNNTTNTTTITVCGTLGSSQQLECEKCMGTGEKVWTAIGCIYASPKGLIESVLPLGIGIAGGIAFLLILFGALQIMTSAGDPEKLNAGKELITAAITGLLLIIFSMFLLQLIGFKILHIPGFG